MVEGKTAELEGPKFSSKEEHPVIRREIDELVSKSRGDDMSSILGSLDEDKRGIGELLYEKLKVLEEYEKDEQFILQKKRKNSTSYKLKEKGKPLIIKCRGTIPIGMMDLVGFILPTNETMPLYDQMFEGEDLVREIHPQIKVVRWRYKGKWPVKARDFVCGSWIHLDNEAFYYIIAPLEDPACPLHKKYVRGTYFGGWIIKPISDEQCDAMYISQLEMAGKVPGWMNDQIMKSEGGIIQNILKARVNYLKKPKK